MELKINKEYRIITDPYNFILQQRKKYSAKSKYAGELYWEDIGYYQKISHLCEGLINKKIINSDDKNWTKLLKTVNDFVNSCEDISIAKFKRLEKDTKDE